MAILKKEYEISVWDETLGEKGQKQEIKRAIIGAHDMDYPGRATSPKLSKKLNGTNIFTFQMPSKYFDSELGEYVHNDFCDYLFNERKIKLQYDGQWYEFYIKNVSENKQFKSIMYQYSCEDAFIDELSRNGYGLTFDTELYNNVEEIGTFTEQILEDSIWEYDATKNWGDFTEYAEEKLFKIPVKMFSKIKGYKLNYKIDGKLTNVFTQESRQLEMGDDLAREQKQFWDNGSFDKGISLLSQPVTEIDTDGYIYVPYSCLNFCYIKNEDEFVATEVAATQIINDIKSYCLAPPSIDPTYLIQFIAIPRNAEVLVDEAGLLVNKEYSYVMTLKDWNECVNTDVYYNSEKTCFDNNEDKISNKVVCYEGYLENINDIEVVFGKKISVTDRTEINISEDINQYVKVYNNTQNEYANLFSSDEWNDNGDYRICSYKATRVIVPQLAQNLVQNGTEMTDISGWEVMKVPTELKDSPSTIEVSLEEGKDGIEQSHGLIFNANYRAAAGKNSEYSTFINFGIVGQEEKITKDQTYVLHVTGNTIGVIDSVKVIIGEGGYDSEGDYTIKDPKIEMTLNPSSVGQSSLADKYFFIRPTINIENPYFAIELQKGSVFNLTKAMFFKAYTKGLDFFNEKGKEGYYKYTGRDIFVTNSSEWNKAKNYWRREAKENEFLLETDIVEGDAYTYERYFRQQIQAGTDAKDTFMLKSYLNSNIEKNGFDPTLYTEEDFKIVTDYVDLNKCSYYDHTAVGAAADCKHKNGNGICMYQKYGYCPYLFQTQKHCRKIRTLNGEKSNRFNLTQELSKVFEIYPIYYTEHKKNGKVITDLCYKDTDEKVIGNRDYSRETYEKMRKKVFYITEKGVENKLGFRYEKNLSNISRTFDSKQIVTKLYVEDVDSELSKTGLCSIKTAEDNPSKDSYIIDFSYYTMRGLLDAASTNADLYGNNEDDMGYLKQLGYYNEKYDELTNLIINLQDESYTELAANIEVNLTGIETAQQEMNKINKTLSRYAADYKESDTKNETYEAYKIKYNEQKNILIGLIEATFIKNGQYYLPDKDIFKTGTAKQLLDYIDKIGFKQFKKLYLDTFKYQEKGMMGQYVAEYNQIQTWKKERAKYLKDINRISLNFFQKYEPYLKEGTWSDSNYLSDNSYYFGAKEVAKQGAIPKVSYNISVVDLDVFDEDYHFDIADTSYVEDIETFGINPKTGLPNRLKVLISGITYDLDIPTQNSIQIQNYTTQFEDLFQQVTASVQSLSFNENIYKRSSNFTATQNITGESLQGGLNDNQLTLIETDEKNISLDHNGQSGSDINNHNNKYKLSGEGLFFSNNGGQTWNVGVTPKGINADYIKVGSLDASKVSIVDGNYLYFLWDKSGITAYREPQATKESSQYFSDFAKFNKYGLSLVENNKIRLRAGYEYMSEDKETEGNIFSEQDIKEDTNIGFYLYDNKGEAIFKTETYIEDSENPENQKDISARISLGGEMFVADKLTSREIQPNLYKDAVIKTKTTSSYQIILNEELNEFKKETSIGTNILSDDIKNYIKGEGGLVFGDSYSNFDGTILKRITSAPIIEYRYFSVPEGTGFTHYYGKTIKANMVTTSEGTSTTEILIFCCINELLYTSTNTSLVIPIKISISSSEAQYEVYSDLKSVSSLSYYESISTKEIATKLIPKTINEKLYYREVDNGFVYYKTLEIGNTKKVISENNSIGIFINNKKVNSEKTEEGLTERLFSCVKIEDENFKNIFSILDDGSLYIGGTVETKEKTGKLEDFPDEITIKGDDNTIILNADGIQIGDMNIQEYVTTRIDDIVNTVSNMGLIAHSHSIGGKKVVGPKADSIAEIDNAVVKSTIDNEGKITFGVAGPYDGEIKDLVSNGKIGVYVTEGGQDMVRRIYWLNPKAYFDNVGLQIALNETTDTTGSGTSGISTATYYVEDTGEWV